MQEGKYNTRFINLTAWVFEKLMKLAHETHHHPADSVDPFLPSPPCPIPKGSPDSPFKRGYCPRCSTAQPASRPAIARHPGGSILFLIVWRLSVTTWPCARAWAVA